jgi:ArsR family transcriptional regulator
MARQIARIETLFKALADATRLRILGLLLTGEVCVCHIHESLKIPQSKASRHLAYLRKAGLVETRREGVWIYYRLAEAGEPTVRAIEQAVRHVLGHVPEIRQDATRLQKRTGCCLPGVDVAPALCCCGAQAQGPEPPLEVRS